MLKALGSRLTYANVVATGALFVALGGGAYALSGIPDRSGVFHGCVSKKTGALRVVASARACHATRRRHGRVVDPGEFAIAWNQKGQKGDPGQKGDTGMSGQTGTPGQNGAAGATKVVVRASTNTTTSNVQNVTCDAGEVATGGGGHVVGLTSGPYLVFSQPMPSSGAPTGWSVDSSSAVAANNLTAYVVCASP